MSTSATSNPSVEDVEKFNTNRLIIYLQSYLQEKNLTLNDSEIQKFHEGEINGYVFLNLTDFLTKCEFSLGKRVVFATLINNLNSQSKFYHKIV